MRKEKGKRRTKVLNKKTRKRERVQRGEIKNMFTEAKKISND